MVKNKNQSLLSAAVKIRNKYDKKCYRKRGFILVIDQSYLIKGHAIKVWFGGKNMLVKVIKL